MSAKTDKMRDMRANGATLQEVADAFGCSRQRVHAVCAIDSVSGEDAWLLDVLSPQDLKALHLVPLYMHGIPSKKRLPGKKQKRFPIRSRWRRHAVRSLVRRGFWLTDCLEILECRTVNAVYEFEEEFGADGVWQTERAARMNLGQPLRIAAKPDTTHKGPEEMP